MNNMETENLALLDRIQLKQVDTKHGLKSIKIQNGDIRVKLRALLVALLGISLSACALTSPPVEMEIDDDVAQGLNNVTIARRVTKPTIRLVMGSGKLSMLVTATTSLLLLLAVMAKQAWWERGVRWLVVPALLVTALEVVTDASDALVAAAVRGTTEPSVAALHACAACVFIAVEILVWYFIAKFFEYNPRDDEENTIIDH